MRRLFLLSVFLCAAIAISFLSVPGRIDPLPRCKEAPTPRCVAEAAVDRLRYASDLRDGSLVHDAVFSAGHYDLASEAADMLRDRREADDASLRSFEYNSSGFEVLKRIAEMGASTEIFAPIDTMLDVDQLPLAGFDLQVSLSYSLIARKLGDHSDCTGPAANLGLTAADRRLLLEEVADRMTVIRENDDDPATGRPFWLYQQLGDAERVREIVESHPRQLGMSLQDIADVLGPEADLRSYIRDDMHRSADLIDLAEIGWAREWSAEDISEVLEEAAIEIRSLVSDRGPRSLALERMRRVVVWMDRIGRRDQATGLLQEMETMARRDWLVQPWSNMIEVAATHLDLGFEEDGIGWLDEVASSLQADEDAIVGIGLVGGFYRMGDGIGRDVHTALAAQYARLYDRDRFLFHLVRGTPAAVLHHLEDNPRDLLLDTWVVETAPNEQSVRIRLTMASLARERGDIDLVRDALAKIMNDAPDFDHREYRLATGLAESINYQNALLWAFEGQVRVALDTRDPLDLAQTSRDWTLCFSEIDTADFSGPLLRTTTPSHDGQ